MKHWLGLFLIFLVVACSSEDESESSQKESVDPEQEFLENKIALHAQAKQRLEDIKLVQSEYLYKKGHYADDFYELMHFLRTEEVLLVRWKGEVPKRNLTEEELIKLEIDVDAYMGSPSPMTEDQARLLSYVIRDTVETNMMGKLFVGSMSRKVRAGEPPFQADSFALVPFSTDSMLMTVGEFEGKRGPEWRLEVVCPLFLPRYFNKDSAHIMDTLTLGSLEHDRLVIQVK